MTEYDTTWLRALQDQRAAEAPTEMTRYPYYYITDYTITEIPHGYDPDSDPTDVETGAGIVITTWNDEFFPDTRAGRARLLGEIEEEGYETRGYTEDYMPYPTVDDPVAAIADFYPHLDYEHASRAWESIPRADLTFLTRAEAERYLARHRDRFNAPERAHTSGEAAYRAESMVRLLHLVENIDLDKSTIVLKDDAAPAWGGF